MSRFLLAVLVPFFLAAGVVQASPADEQAGEDFVNGQRYYLGDGVPQDYARAALLFRRAAGNGHAYAQYSLALMHEHGYGVDRNRDEAIKWYQQAAKRGDLRASRRLEAMGADVPAPTVAFGRSQPRPQLSTRPLEPMDPAPRPLTPTTPYAVTVAPAAPRPIVSAAPAPPAAPTTAASDQVLTAPVPLPPPSPPPVAYVPPAKGLEIAPPVPLEPIQPIQPPAQAKPVLTPVPPPAAAPTPIPSSGELSPLTAQAMATYRSSLASKNYGAALAALEQALDGGRLPALGLDEMGSAQELARVALLSGDGALARVYLMQAVSLGSAPAQAVLSRLELGTDPAELAERLEP